MHTGIPRTFIKAFTKILLVRHFKGLLEFNPDVRFWDNQQTAINWATKSKEARQELEVIVTELLLSHV
jgi:hypothetical protein